MKNKEYESPDVEMIEIKMEAGIMSPEYTPQFIEPFNDEEVW